MGTTSLKSFLMNVCNNSCWSYAVFWKLQPQDQLFLIWEDGYLGTLKEENSMGSIFADTCIESLKEMSSSNTYRGALGEDAVEPALAYMSCIQYALGEGVVGEAASTGNHRWVFSESKSSEFNTTPFLEHADECLFQFAAGIKTILLVPVLPHGVLQLGSFETLSEDAAVTAYIKNQFFTHQDFMSYSESFAMDNQLPVQSPSSLADLDVIESTVSRSLVEDFPTISNSNNSSMRALGEYGDRPSLPEISTNQQLLNEIGPMLSFPKDCELHKALGPAFMAKTNQENLFGDVVTTVHCDENSTIQTRGGGLPTSSFGDFSSLVENVFGGESSLSRQHVESIGKNVSDSTSPSVISYEDVIAGLIEEREQNYGYNSLSQRRGSKPAVGNKRRGKPVSKPKPRPRDRQLIQDRLKELREHVPDGSKCSIDGLLDRTIKHMLFLKSVSDHADKLRRCAQPEAGGQLDGARATQNGASWAFELEGDQQICPIIIEDLQYPGHMIIEIICNESSRFFEIAEVIHCLELTILKGVMETRSGNTWAHFVIEAPRGLHRLDIFWPLMKLVQQQQHGPISSKI